MYKRLIAIALVFVMLMSVTVDIKATEVATATVTLELLTALFVGLSAAEIRSESADLETLFGVEVATKTATLAQLLLSASGHSSGEQLDNLGVTVDEAYEFAILKEIESGSSNMHIKEVSSDSVVTTVMTQSQAEAAFWDWYRPNFGYDAARQQYRVTIETYLASVGIYVNEYRYSDSYRDLLEYVPLEFQLFFLKVQSDFYDLMLQMDYTKIMVNEDYTSNSSMLDMCNLIVDNSGMSGLIIGQDIIDAFDDYSTYIAANYSYIAGFYDSNYLYVYISWDPLITYNSGSYTYPRTEFGTNTYMIRWSTSTGIRVSGINTYDNIGSNMMSFTGDTLNNTAYSNYDIYENGVLSYISGGVGDVLLPDMQDDRLGYASEIDSNGNITGNSVLGNIESTEDIVFDLDSEIITRNVDNVEQSVVGDTTITVDIPTEDLAINQSDLSSAVDTMQEHLGVTRLVQSLELLKTIDTGDPEPYSISVDIGKAWDVTAGQVSGPLIGKFDSYNNYKIVDFAFMEEWQYGGYSIHDYFFGLQAAFMYFYTAMSIWSLLTSRETVSG